MAYLIKNISKDLRKFRVHKVSHGFCLRPSEEVEVPYNLVYDRPDVFKVINLDKEELKKSEEEEVEKTSKKTKLNKEDR